MDTLARRKSDCAFNAGLRCRIHSISLTRLFRIFLSVLRDGFMASVTWRRRLIQIRLPCAKRLGDVLRFCC